MVSPDSDFKKSESRILDFGEAEIGRHQILVMYNLYILKLNNDSYYIGSTEDLNKRIDLHQKGRVKSTKCSLPVELVYNEECNTRSKAQRREYQIKKWKSRKAIERLINKAPSSSG